jgi:acyl-coenzyme A synthetase/AMP-(fatty) acid ligase
MRAAILFESEAKSDIHVLDAAWSSPETFAFVPDKLAISTDWINAALDSLPNHLKKNHFALLTSGSTGRPKLIVAERQRAESMAQFLDEVQLGAAATQTIVTLPLTYCYAFVNQWLWARVNNRKLILTEGFSDPNALTREFEHAQDAMLCLVGAQVPLLMSLMEKVRFPGIVRLHFAGGQFPQEHLDSIRDFFPNAMIFNNYGCAEAMPRLSVRLADATIPASNIGQPLPGIEFSTDTDGSLLFRSPFCASAFVEEDELTLTEQSAWIPTGDFGRMTDDGSFELQGRTREVFKRYGEKVSLSQLLATVQMSWKGEAALFREKDGGGEDGCVLVLAPHPEDAESRLILRDFRKHHSRAQWPLRIEGSDHIPKLQNGKIDTSGLCALENKTIYWRQRI